MIPKWFSSLWKTKATTTNPGFLLDFSAMSATGVRVGPDTAMRQSAVYSCVNILAESVGSLPLRVFRRRGADREQAPYHPLWNILKNRPNRWQTSQEWREQMMASLLLRGVAYSRKVESNGEITSLIPLHPDSVTMLVSDTEFVFYDVPRIDGTGLERIPRDQMLAINHLPMGGYLGVSPIQFCRETIGLAAAAELFGAKLFGASARPAGVLEHPGRLDKPQQQRLSESWRAAFSGPENVGKVAVVDGGMKWQQLTMTAEDAQFLEIRRFQQQQIASIFRVPPHMIGSMENATFSNIEHQAIEFVQHSLTPWLVRFEQSFARDLFRPDDQFFAEFQVEGLLRGDLKSRFDSYSQGLQSGWLSINDVRRLENMNPVDGGDEYLRPLNMAVIGDATANNG